MTDDSSPWVKFTHIGIVVHDLEKAVAQYEAIGLGPFKRFELPNEDFLKFKYLRHFGRDASDNVYKVAWGKFGDLAMEIFQPIAGDSIPSRILSTKGEGVWHYGYDVEDMEQTVAWMRERGYGIVGESETEEGVRMSYFATDEVGGVLFQAHEVPASSSMYGKLEGEE